MPTVKEVDYLDGEFTVLEETPANIAELAAAGVGEEDIIGLAVSNLYYRNKYPRVYGKVSAEVETLGFPRAVTGKKKKKDDTFSDIKESENDHLRAFLFGRKDESGVISTPAPEENRTTLTALFEKHGVAEPLYVKGERSLSGGGKVSQQATDLANLAFSKGPEIVEKAVEAIEAFVPGYKVSRGDDGEVTPESLARGIQARSIKVKRDAEAASKAAMGALLGA